MFRKYQKYIREEHFPFFIVIAILYISFLCIDFSNLSPQFKDTLSSTFKYASILLCLVYVGLKSHHEHHLFLALLFTLLADTILVWTDMEFLGVTIFCIAQYCHTKRIRHKPNRSIDYYPILLMIIFALSTILNHQPIYLVSTIYASNLFLNLILANRKYRQHPNVQNFALFLGFILFVCCDSCVAFRHLTLDGALPHAILPFTSYLVWFFYLPSQFLLSQSANYQKVAKPIQNS